jgi:hypothetical protein
MIAPMTEAQMRAKIQKMIRQGFVVEIISDGQTKYDLTEAGRQNIMDLVVNFVYSNGFKINVEAEDEIIRFIKDGTKTERISRLMQAYEESLECQ